MERKTIKIGDILDENISLFLSDAENKEISILNKVERNLEVSLDVNSLASLCKKTRCFGVLSQNTPRMRLS